MARTELLNGCWRSKISVTPKNWNTAAASTKKDWRIWYRFYDPVNKPKGKLIPVKGFNSEKDLKERQQAVKHLIRIEEQLIDEDGWNPVTKQYMTEEEAPTGDIGSNTLFIPALFEALEMLKVGRMKSDIKYCIKGIKKAAAKLPENEPRKYTKYRIDQIKRKHLIYILNQCRKDKPEKFTANRFNKYRDYLIMLFKQLIIIEAVESDPVSLIPKEKTTKKKRQLPTDAERLIIDTNLKAWDYYYWRYIRIFHRSSCRNTEMHLLRETKVDIARQEFIVLVKKDKQYVESTRPIPDDILPLWVEVLSECQPGDYLFSVGYKPGPRPIDPNNTSKRWRILVKKKMGINKDEYSLKAHNTDTIDAQLDLEHAAAAAGHKSTKTTEKHYTPGHQQRKIDKLKKVKVDF